STKALTPELALSLDAIFGGVAGYRDLVNVAPAHSRDLASWLTTNVLNPSHALFREPDYVLAEDPRTSDRAIYHAIWDAVASGASTPTKIGAVVGVDARNLEY